MLNREQDAEECPSTSLSADRQAQGKLATKAL